MGKTKQGKKDPQSEDSNQEESEKKSRNKISERVRQYLIRAHSFQEVGTESLPDQDYDILHFPHILLAAGVIMAVYGYFIISISTDYSAYSAYVDGLIILITGNIICTLGMIKLLTKYWGSFLILVLISCAIIFTLMALWDFFIVPWAVEQGITDYLPEEPFIKRTGTVVLTTFTFAYTACLVWFIGARYTSALYFNLFARGKGKRRRFFIVDPWRKTIGSKASLISDILGRVFFPFFFLLTLITTLSEQGDLFFIQVDWTSYFDSVLIMYVLLCAMVVLFPAFWLLDYIREYNEERLEVNSLGEKVLILVKGYAGFGTVFTFISRSQGGFVSALLEFYMLAMYLIPSLIVLIGGYVLLTERDVFYIAQKVVHGNRVIVEYKLIDSTGKELKWWIEPLKPQNLGDAGGQSK